jgi:hypothetical protein
MSEFIKVFIGNDKDRARLILQELEDTTDVVWEHNGTRPLFIFQGWTDPIWIYFKKGKLESRWFSHTGIEVTPREFIESIQKEYPKNREIKKTTEDIGYCVFIGGDNDKLKYILNKLKTETNIKKVMEKDGFKTIEELMDYLDNHILD